MDVVEALKTRKSIRGFKPTPVSKAVLKEVLEIAARAPSAVNSQPWELFVLAGDVLEEVKRANIDNVRAGTPPNPDHGFTGWPRDSVYRRRQVDLAKQLFKLMEITKDDGGKMREWIELGYRFFDAPAAILIVIDKSIVERAPLLDVGALMQSVCLSALHHGLGTCIEDQGAMYPEVLRRFAGIPESKKIIISIAVGYPDWDFPANKVLTAREPLDAITTWCGFE